MDKNSHRQSSELTMSILNCIRVRLGLLLSEQASPLMRSEFSNPLRVNQPARRILTQTLAY